MSKLTVSYNNANIIDTSDDGSFTLTTKDKSMLDNIYIAFDSGPSEEYDGSFTYTAS